MRKKLGAAMQSLDGPKNRAAVEIASTPMQLKKRGKGMVAVPGTNLPPLTAQQVRETLERMRR